MTTLEWPKLVTLRDGARLTIRPIEPDDKEAMLRGFEELSPESRRRRFLVATERLTPKLLAYLTEVDHVDHEALVAEGADNAEPIGVARYVRLVDEPDTAEVAVTVVDRWQHRGVASELLVRLGRRAVENGITRFSGTCFASNEEALELIRTVPGTTVRPTDNGLVEITVDLPAAATDTGTFRVALREAAAGSLEFNPPRAPSRLLRRRSSLDHSERA
jgi:GNAT superfamily N-acetyltransferase